MRFHAGINFGYVKIKSLWCIWNFICQISSNVCKEIIEFISCFFCIKNVSFVDSNFSWKSWWFCGALSKYLFHNTPFFSRITLKVLKVFCETIFWSSPQIETLNDFLTFEKLIVLLIQETERGCHWNLRFIRKRKKSIIHILLKLPSKISFRKHFASAVTAASKLGWVKVKCAVLITS